MEVIEKISKSLGKPPKKMAKNFTHVVNYGRGGQQILVCEPQKSAFFGANFPKNMLKLIQKFPICLSKQNKIT